MSSHNHPKTEQTDLHDANDASLDASLSFESAVAALESIVADMESGKLELNDSLAAYKRGAKLLQICQKSLQDAEQQVRILSENALTEFKPIDDA
jgi:exodeoxyribonuclease VII small subunit